MWRRCSRTSKVIVKTLNIIFTKIITVLYFNKNKRDFTYACHTML